MFRLLSLLQHASRTLRYEVIRAVSCPEAAARHLGVTVGKGCRILTRGFGTEPWLIAIGDRVTITNGVHLLTHDGSTWLFRDSGGRRYRYARIVIGDDVFIGINSILLPGVQVGNRVIIGAGSVVTKSVPSGVLVAGNPARVIGLYEDHGRIVLRDYPAVARMVGLSQEERMRSVVDEHMRPSMLDESNSG